MDVIKPKYVQNLINKFCLTIGMIPSSYKQSLTYEEQIMAIGHYLEETVYPAINNNAEALAELQNLFIELKNYVDNYFSELNVQTQIDNKLDAMAQDGSLAEIINQEIFGDIQNDIEALQGDVNDINDSIGTINDDIDTIEGNISTINDDIDTIEGNISTINDDIDNVEGNISTINDDIDTIEGNILTINDDINTAESNIFDINKKLKIEPFTVCRGIAHRGLSGDAPENTIPAIRKAGQYGCFGIEIDVQTTLDNEIVLMHDNTVDRMTNGTGTVNGLEYSYINSLVIDSGKNIGYYTDLKVPTIQQALVSARYYGLHVMIELKGTWSTPNLQKLLDIIKLYGMDENVSIISFTHSYIGTVRTLNSTIPLALLYSSTISTELIDSASEIGNCMLSVAYDNNLVIPDAIRNYLLEKNVKYGFWTVNDIAIARNLINNNQNLSFIVGDYGYGMPIKQTSKFITALITSDGLVSWPKYLELTNNQSNNIATNYEDFTVELREGTTKEYYIYYNIPYFTEYFTNFGNVHAKMLLYGKDLVNVVCHNQSPLGFIIEFYDNDTGNQLSLAELYTLVGTRYINFIIEF